MKCPEALPSAPLPGSRPARALWIEINALSLFGSLGLGRGPRGPCGLKLRRDEGSRFHPLSRPARALWIEMPTRVPRTTYTGSRPARALWIEIFTALEYACIIYSRGPRGPCGLKSGCQQPTAEPAGSRPARALWIEIHRPNCTGPTRKGRGPRGPCGLKSLLYHTPNGKNIVEAREGLVD